MNQDTAALDVAQKGIAQAGSQMSPFNQTGDIRQDQLILVIEIDYTQIWFKSGEGIIGDFGFGIGNCSQQAGFSRVGHAHDSDIRDQFQFQPQDFFFPGLAFFSCLWSLVTRVHEVRISPASPPAFADDQSLAFFHQVTEELTRSFIKDNRSGWNLDNTVFSIPTGLVVDTALFPFFRVEPGLVLEGIQGVHMRVDLEDEIPSTTAITTIGAAPGNKFFPVEVDHAIPALAGSY
jgi:hypothetical protein